MKVSYIHSSFIGKRISDVASELGQSLGKRINDVSRSQMLPVWSRTDAKIVCRQLGYNLNRGRGELVQFIVK